MNKFLLGVIIATAITLIVFAAIAADALGLLIFGIVIVGLVVIGLSAIGVNLFSRYTDATHKMRSLQYDHAERVMKLGYLPEGRGYVTYRQLAQPQRIDTTPRLPSGGNQNGIQFVATDPQVLAVNLLLFTIQLGRENGNTIASAPECAAAGIVGYSTRKRDYAVRYLEQKYHIVTASGNGGGTFVPEEIGTVGALYHMVVRNSAVDALPENKR